MSLSKKRDAARKKAEYWAKKEAKMDRNTIVMPKRLVRLMKAVGMSPERAYLAGAVTLEAYKDLERRLEAKTRVIEGGYKFTIPRMNNEIAVLKARLETIQSTDLVLMLQSRVTDLEAEIALMQAQTR